MLSVPARAGTYHVDSQTGDDSRDGLSPGQAWKSLAPVNARVFQPGDKVLFKAGTRYSGQIKPSGSGAIVDGRLQPITLGMYGSGDLPRIDGQGAFPDTVALRNVEYWIVEDLEVTNLGTNRQPWRTGVRIESDGFGKMRGIHLRRLFVHDVNGDLRKSHEGCGIFFESTDRESHFDGLVIENCHVVRIDRNGICQRSRSRAASRGVVIRGNLLEDIGGDGIKCWGSTGALVERNILRGGRMRCEDAAAGIWPFASDDTVIQFNEVSGMKGTIDGQGFDSDYQCRNSVFQYNYSHDNEGGFMLVCSPGNSFCENTVIRYNISQNDGLPSSRIFQIGGAARNTRIHNNVIFVGAGRRVPLVAFNEWSRGSACGTFFENNIFYVEGQVTNVWDKGTNTVFENNIFYGDHLNRPSDTHGSTNRPPLVNPGAGGDGFQTLGGYKLRNGPAAPRGKVIPDNGGHDFFGNPVPSGNPPCIGVFEAVAN